MSNIMIWVLVGIIYVLFILLCIKLYDMEKSRVTRNKAYNKAKGKEILNTSMIGCYIQIILYLIYVNTLLYIVMMKTI